MNPSWAITPQKVESAIQKIIEVSSPQKIILFGSYIKGGMHLNSDLDVLIISGDDITSPRKESVRIRRALKGIIMSIDIQVVTESKLQELISIHGLIYKEAVQNGKLIYEAV